MSAPEPDWSELVLELADASSLAAAVSLLLKQASRCAESQDAGGVREHGAAARRNLRNLWSVLREAALEPIDPDNLGSLLLARDRTAAAKVVLHVACQRIEDEDLNSELYLDGALALSEEHLTRALELVRAVRVARSQDAACGEVTLTIPETD